LNLSFPGLLILFDTLVYLNEKYPHYQFVIIVGSDSLKNIHKWKNSELLLKQFSFIVYQRPGFEINEVSQEKIHLLKAPLFDISSTYIRNAIQNGKSIKYLVPDKVLEEIERNGYYKK